MRLLSLGEAESIRESLNQDKQKHVPTWMLLSKFISPSRYKDDNSKVSGTRKDQNIINNRAGLALRTFVSGMHNGGTPRSRNWFTLTSSDIVSKTYPESKRYFSDSEKVLNNSFQISNLYRVLPIAYKDVGTFSNAAFAQLPHPRYGMYFYPFAVGTYSFSCDNESNPNMFTRDFAMTVRQVIEEFAVYHDGRLDFADIPQCVVDLYKKARYNDRVVMTTLIVPNPEYNPNDLYLHPANKKFQSYTWVIGYNDVQLHSTNSIGFREMTNTRVKEDAPFMRTSGYSYFPIIIPRWEVEADGWWGTDGPGHLALSDVISLQVMEKFRYNAIEKIVDPPMVGPASLKRHGSSILAGGITYVDDYAQGQAFRSAIEIPQTINDLINKQEEIKQEINEYFFVDLFMMLNSERKISHVTQREIDARESERMSALTPVLGQFDHDLTSKIIGNGLFILGEQDKLPERPKVLEGIDIRPEYISTLAQAAKASQMVTVERVLNFGASMAQATGDPTVIKMLDNKRIMREYADYAGLDPNFLLSEDEFNKLQKEEQAKIAQQRAAALQNQASQTTKNLAQAPVGAGTALDELMGGAQ